MDFRSLTCQLMTIGSGPLQTHISDPTHLPRASPSVSPLSSAGSQQHPPCSATMLDNGNLAGLYQTDTSREHLMSDNFQQYFPGHEENSQYSCENGQYLLTTNNLNFSPANSCGETDNLSQSDSFGSDFINMDLGSSNLTDYCSVPPALGGQLFGPDSPNDNIYSPSNENSYQCLPTVKTAGTWCGDLFNSSHPAEKKVPVKYGQKVKRKRIINKQQRVAANHRERSRMLTMNVAFDQLKEKIPVFSEDKKLSRIETLRLAISYIKFMGDLVNGKSPEIDTSTFEKMLEKFQQDK